MAKIGYIYKSNDYDNFESDKSKMQEYGCIQIVEESTEQEVLRPKWRQLLAGISRGDEIYIAKFSNAVRGTREMAEFIELCRIKAVRIVSINDEVDTKNEFYPDTKASDIIYMFGALPEEIAALRNASSHIIELQKKIISYTKEEKKIVPKAEREKLIVDMYQYNYSIDEIWAMSGYKCRASVFNILRKHGVKLNRGKFSGPLGKRKPKE